MSISDSELHHDPFLSSIFPSMDEDDQSWLTGSMETMEDLPSPTLPSPTAAEMRSSIQCNLSRGMQHQLKHGWTSGLDLKQESDDVLDLETALRQEEAQVKWYQEQQRLRQQYRFDMQPEAPAVQPVFTAADIEQVRSQFMQRHANDSTASHVYQSPSTASSRSVPASSTDSAPSCSSSTSTFSSSTYAPLSNSTFPSLSTCTASSSRPIPPPPAPPAMPSSSTASSSPMSNFHQQHYLAQQQHHRHQQAQGQHTSSSYGSTYHSFHGGLSSSAPNAPATSTMQSYVPGTTPMPLHAALNAHFHPQCPEVNPRPQHSLFMHPNAYMRSIAAANSSASAPANAVGTPTTNNPFSIVGPFSSDQSFLSSSVPPPPPPAPAARRRSKSSKSSSKTSSKGRGRRSTSSKSKRAQGGKSVKSLLAQERPRNALGHFISVKELQQQLEELKNKLELSQSQYRQLQERLSCTEVELESLRTQVGSPGLDVNQHNKRMRAKRAAVVESMRASSPMSISKEPALSTSDGAVFSPEQHTHAFPL